MKKLFQNRWVRALAWTVVSIVTLYALIYAWMNWTGARMLRDAMARLKAEGETTDFRALTNEPIPDADNFCAIPALKDLALRVDDDSENSEPGARRKRLETLKFPVGDKIPTRPRLSNGASFGQPADLKEWNVWLKKAGVESGKANSENPERNVLEALSIHDALISELASGIERPKAQWTPAWRTREMPELLFETALPHTSMMQGVSQYLALRATAAAHVGDIKRAHQTLQIIAKINEANLNDPFIIGLLVAATGSSSMVNATWEVCDAQCGSASDFVKLESALLTANFQRSTLQAWRTELAAALNAVEYMKRKADGSTVAIMNGMIKPENDKMALLIDRLLPDGFFDGNAAIVIGFEFDHMIKPIRDQGWTEVIASATASLERLQKEKQRFYLHPFHYFMFLSYPALNSVTFRIVFTQCLVDQATIACALERHRLEKGGYPDSLDGLKLANGKALPLDALSGKPMGYRKTENGKYALWCVGFDGKDDGGQRVLDEKNPQDTKFADKNYKGDWVWDFPAPK